MLHHKYTKAVHIAFVYFSIRLGMDCRSISLEYHQVNFIRIEEQERGKLWK